MPPICPYYGTPAGCRAGRSCQNLHVAHDGSAVPTKAAPETAHAERDRFRTRVQHALQAKLLQEGSTTEVTGVAFLRGARPQQVRVRVRTTQLPSEKTQRVRAAGGMQWAGDWFGKGCIGHDATLDGGDVLFFHGTTFELGWRAMSEGRFRALADNDPVGHYTALVPLPAYARGCVAECTDRGVVLSKAETAHLRRLIPGLVVPEATYNISTPHIAQHACGQCSDRPLSLHIDGTPTMHTAYHAHHAQYIHSSALHQGLICVNQRAQTEYVHNPKSCDIKAFTFPFDLLAWHLGIDPTGLPDFAPRLRPDVGLEAKAPLAPRLMELRPKAPLAKGPPKAPPPLHVPAPPQAPPPLRLPAPPTAPPPRRLPAPKTPPRPPSRARTPRRAPRASAPTTSKAPAAHDDESWGRWRPH